VSSNHKNYFLQGFDQVYRGSIHHCMSDVHGGAVGLYENHEALTLFMFAGPDCTRCIKEFETVLNPTTSNTAHHEEASALQTKFRTNVLAFVEAVEQLGKTFNNGKDLVALHTQEVMEEEVVTSLK